MSNIISCKNVWKLYGTNPKKYLKSFTQLPSYEKIKEDGYIAAVRDINLEIKSNEILVIMGLSGSGKSTLLRCLSRLIEITSGNIEIEGRNLGTLNEKELIELRREKMGMVFQNFALLPHRTVLDNIAFPLEMRGQEKHDRRKKALKIIELVGLEGREDYYPRELSGGQQQRVGIARSLVIEPDIWFLDEPFSALDPLIRSDMQKEFLRLQKMMKKTIVFVTHDFNEAIRLADRIAIMKDGSIQQLDIPDEIVLNPANEYIKKFTEEVDNSRIVRIGALTEKIENLSSLKGHSVYRDDKLHTIMLDLINDKRKMIPVADQSGNIVGGLNRQKVLKVLMK